MVLRCEHKLKWTHSHEMTNKNDLINITLTTMNTKHSRHILEIIIITMEICISFHFHLMSLCSSRKQATHWLYGVKEVTRLSFIWYIHSFLLSWQPANSKREMSWTNKWPKKTDFKWLILIYVLNHGRVHTRTQFYGSLNSMSQICLHNHFYPLQ